MDTVQQPSPHLFTAKSSRRIYARAEKAWIYIMPSLRDSYFSQTTGDCRPRLQVIPSLRDSGLTQESGQRQYRFAACVQQYDRADDKHGPMNVHVNALHPHHTHKGGIPARFR